MIDPLVGVANAHPQVMKRPPPNAFLVGYGDSSINFELRAWTDQSSSQTEIRSDLATAVYDAVTAVEMTFPYPQREVRLLRDGDAAPAIPSIDAEKKRKDDVREGLPRKDAARIAATKSE